MGGFIRDITMHDNFFKLEAWVAKAKRSTTQFPEGALWDMAEQLDEWHIGLPPAAVDMAFDYYPSLDAYREVNADQVDSVSDIGMVTIETRDGGFAVATGNYNLRNSIHGLNSWRLHLP